MEPVTNLQCACGNCDVVIDYRAEDAGQIVECPACKQKSRLPEPMPINTAQPDEFPEIRPVAPPRLCPACGANMAPYGSTCETCENKRRRTLRLFAGVASAVLVLGVGWLFLKRFYNTAPPPGPTYPAHATLAPPRVKTPKSMNDFKISSFALESQRGSSLIMAVGDIQNTSLNLYGHVRADADVLNATGAKIGTVSADVNELRSGATWHFIATVKDPRAKTVRFAGLKEIP